MGCPDCGTLCFASRETCFKCDRNSAGGNNRRPGDWDCPDCGALVFASKSTCFRCDREDGGSNGGKGKGVKRKKITDVDKQDFSGHAAIAVKTTEVEQTASAAIKAFARASPVFKSAWNAYCKQYGQGFSDPTKYEEIFLADWADHVGALTLTALDQPIPEELNHLTAAKLAE